MQTIFHLAFNVTNLEVAREFYSNVLGCKQGRESDSWIDYDFFGHQLSLHLGKPFSVEKTGFVDNIAVPMPHFGAVLPLDEWNVVADRLKNMKVNFIIAPSVRFIGTTGEQSTMFFTDPFGNPIELKGFANFENIFK